MYYLEKMKEDLAFVSMAVGRMSGVLERTTFCREQDAPEMQKIQEQIGSLRTQTVEVIDNFFSWHNKLIRSARQR